MCWSVIDRLTDHAALGGHDSLTARLAEFSGVPACFGFPFYALSRLPVPLLPGPQIALGVLGELEGVIGPVQGSLQVRQHYVDPACIVMLAARTAVTFDHRMRMLFLQCPERSQPIAVDISAGAQALQDPRSQRLLGEARHRIDHRMPRTTVFSGLHGDHERALVLRTAPGLAAIALPPR